MQDRDKTKEQLIQELVELRQRFAEVEQAAQSCHQSESLLQGNQVELEQAVETQNAALKSANALLLAEIADREQAEADLRSAQDQLEAVLEAVPGIVSWISSDLHYLGVNRRLAKTFGLPPEAFAGQHIGFLSSSNQFNDFVRQFFDSPAQDAFREVTAMVNGVPRTFLIVVQKYDGDRAAFAVGIDISERHQAEAALRKAEARYRSIFENAVEGIFQTTVDGSYLIANSTLARIYGYESPEDLIANLTDVQQQLYVDPNRRAQFSHILQTQGAVLGFESQVYHKDGSLIWISENASAVYGDDGNLYYEGTVEDITERKHAEEALQRATEELEIRVEERTVALKELNRRLVLEIGERQRAEEALRSSEAELRALFAAMTDIITVFDGQGRYLKMVETNSRQVYKPETDRLGKTVYEILPPAQATLFMSYIQRALNKGKTVTLEYSLPISNAVATETGKSIEAWFVANVSPMPDHRVIWVARDITNRKQAEEALRQSETKEREKSQQLAQTLQELQQTQAQLVQSEKMSSLGLLVAGVAHEINNPVNFIYGNLVYATRYSEDLLDLLQLYQQAVPAPAADLRQKVETIDLEFVKSDLRKLMASMRVGAERIREIVRSLQSFSRIDGAELKVVDVHEGIESSLMILHHRLTLGSATAIEVVRDYGDLPPIKCYAGQLNQVFMNILSNAIDAIEARCGNLFKSAEPDDQSDVSIEPLIHIHTEVLNGEAASNSEAVSDSGSVSNSGAASNNGEPPGSRLVIHIKDNGLGMPIDVQQHVFDPFFTTKPVGKGTGLGLSISHQIVVERHGGQLHCISTPGVGTEFAIELPLQPVE